LLQDYAPLNLLPLHAFSTGPQTFYSPCPPSLSALSSHPSLLSITAAEIMCGGEGSTAKTVVKLELQLPQDSSFAYQPGDSIGIFPPNSDDDVQLLLQRCCSPLSAGFELPNAASAAPRGIINSEAFLKWGVDLRVCVTKKVATCYAFLSLFLTFGLLCAIPLLSCKRDADAAAAAAKLAWAASTLFLQILRELSCWCSDAAEGNRLLQVSNHGQGITQSVTHKQAACSGGRDAYDAIVKGGGSFVDVLRANKSCRCICVLACFMLMIDVYLMCS
jgi:hypothetical protein